MWCALGTFRSCKAFSSNVIGSLLALPSASLVVEKPPLAFAEVNENGVRRE
jgi:hypothetical protein